MIPQPTFIGVGVQNSGTTWLAGCLQQHPQICMPVKELHFFDEDCYEKKGWLWYSQHFAPVPGKVAYGEWTPEYLFNDLAFERMSRDLGPVKILAVFRNPVDRAYSTYWRYRTSGFTNLDFVDALEEHTFFRERSCYFGPWQRFVERYGPDNCLPLLFEPMRQTPAATFRQVFRFLGVNDDFQPKPEHVTKNTQKFNRSQRAVDYLTGFKHALRRHHLGFVVTGARKMGLRNLVAAANEKHSDYPVRLTQDQRTAVYDTYFRDDAQQFAKLTRLNLDVWHESHDRRANGS